MANEGESWVETLLMVRRLIYDGLREDLVRTKLGSDRQALDAYLIATMHNLPEERMLAIFADADGFVIAEEVIAEGEASHVHITPRRIFGRALKLEARRIVLVHNHPSGSATPSQFDIERTLLLVQQAKILGLSIDDHLIVGDRQVTSMKDRGFM